MLKSLHLNWGQAIVLSYVLFAGFVVTLVYRMSHQRVDLVRAGYYESGIDYQRQVDRIRNAKPFHSINVMNYSPDAQRLTIALPTAVSRGEVLLYRPSDERQDFRVVMPKAANSVVNIPTDHLTAGRWRVEATWFDGNREYFLEEELMIEE
ncbi:MAG: FixH family protein [Sphingobacteriaceae bacterium]|nr:FixH family protein [Cytophagaceae bacterium]